MKEHECRAIHLTDSYVCMSIISKGRTSSDQLLSILRRISAVCFSFGIWSMLSLLKTQRTRPVGASDLGFSAKTQEGYYEAVRKAWSVIEKSRTCGDMDDLVSNDAPSGLHYFIPATKESFPLAGSYFQYGDDMRCPLELRLSPLTWSWGLLTHAWQILISPWQPYFY